MNALPTTYTVHVDDNAHYMDETHRVQDATFTSLEDAVGRCMAITDACLADLHEDGMTANSLYLLYTQFGEDPWICTEPHDGSPPPFSARTYAHAKCIEICEPTPDTTSTEEANNAR